MKKFQVFSQKSSWILCFLFSIVFLQSCVSTDEDVVMPTLVIDTGISVDTSIVGQPYWSFARQADWEEWIQSMGRKTAFMRMWYHNEFGVDPFTSYESWYDSSGSQMYWPFAVSISSQSYIAYRDTVWRMGPLYSSYHTDTGWCSVPTLMRSGIVSQSFVDTVVHAYKYRVVASHMYQQDCWKRWQHSILVRSEHYTQGKWQLFPVEEWSYATHVIHEGEEIYPEPYHAWYPGVWVLPLPLEDVQGDVHVHIADEGHALYGYEVSIQL